MVSAVNPLRQQQARCRYCRAPAMADQPLVTPCQCRGSLTFAHVACLEACFGKRPSDDRRCGGCGEEIFVPSHAL